MNQTPVHDATTVILVREDGPAPRVLMGRRSRNAVFMADKLVFPGGRVDPGDRATPLALPDHLRSALARQNTTAPPEALVAAGFREVFEETGLKLARPERFRLVFRAITPPGRSRRFDARFLLAPAAAIEGDPDDFSGAGGELSDLRWRALDADFGSDLAFITSVVLSEVAAILRDPSRPRPVPFLQHRDGLSRAAAL